MDRVTERVTATLLIAVDRVLTSRHEILPYLKTRIIQSIREEIGKVSDEDIDEFLKGGEDEPNAK